MSSKYTSSHRLRNCVEVMGMIAGLVVFCVILTPSITSLNIQSTPGFQYTEKLADNKNTDTQRVHVIYQAPLSDRNFSSDPQHSKGSETIAENNEDTQIENDAQKSKLLELEESESDNQKETNLTHLIGSESNVKVDQSSGEGKKKSSGLETNIGSAGQATDGADFGTVLAKLSKSDYGSMNTRSKWDLGLAVKAAMYQIMSIPLEVTDLRGNLRLTAKIRNLKQDLHQALKSMSLDYFGESYESQHRGDPTQLVAMHREKGVSEPDMQYAATATLKKLISESGVDVGRVVVANSDEELTTCQEAKWELHITDADGKSVDNAGLSFYAELRGPAIIVPRVTYQGNGVYNMHFTPHTPGEYNVLIRLDFARHAGDQACTNENTSFMLAQKLPNAPETITVASKSNGTGPNRNGTVASHMCGEGTSRTDHERYTLGLPTGQWIEVSCKEPADDFEREACDIGLVEFVTGSIDKAIPDSPDRGQPENCQWERDYPKKEDPNYLWRAFSPTYSLFPTDELKNTWVHVMGDSIDRFMLSDTMCWLLNHKFAEEGRMWEVPYLDPTIEQPQNRLRTSVRVYHWPKANVTFSYYSFTKRVRIPHVRMYNDNYKAARQEWPGRTVHALWATIVPLTKMYRPSVFVLAYHLHPASEGLTDDIYRDTLKQTIGHLRSGPGQGTPIVWRRGTTTHMHRSELPKSHHCLLNDRLRALDAVAMQLIHAEDIDVIDEWSSSLGRKSATSDNRHYEDRRACKGTKVQMTHANLWLNQIADMRRRGEV